MELLCTIGPSSLEERILHRLADNGVTLFRINLSHTDSDELEAIINFIKGLTDVPVCIDTEGAQIRTGKIKAGELKVEENTLLEIRNSSLTEKNNSISLYPESIEKTLKIGDFLSIDFNEVLVRVIKKNIDSIIVRVINGGKIGQNKAVTLHRDIILPSLTEKDKTCINIAKNLGIKHFALSFTNKVIDVVNFRELVGDTAFIIAKIESIIGYNNLDDILGNTDAILLDRGDMSREINIEYLPVIQKQIIKKCNTVKKKVYVATNLLESMTKIKNPTRAEVNDIYNTIIDGADGLVLAAETAIGDYPILCVEMVNRLIKNTNKPFILNKLDNNQYSTNLIKPHGNDKLVNNLEIDYDPESINGYKRVTVDETILLDCEQIATGTYTPIKGFMDSATLNSVLENMKLPNGVIWTMPIIFQLKKDDYDGLTISETIILTDIKKTPYAKLIVEELYNIDLDDITSKWFGTNSDEHPGVSRMKNKGNFIVAGEVTLLRHIPSLYQEYKLTPRQTRFIFFKKGWSRVIGFHTRNIIHNGHEYIQKDAMAKVYADGILISPVVGPKKKGDFHHSIILETYQRMIDNKHYPQDKVLLGSFSTYSRYCGPREAVFTAICRKNMGCTHFIIGRDHTGVGNYYSKDANYFLFEKLGNIDIKPIFYGEVGYSKKDQKLKFISPRENYEKISGSELRKLLINAGELPNWFMRDDIQDLVHDKMRKGDKIFI